MAKAVLRVCVRGGEEDLPALRFRWVDGEGVAPPPLSAWTESTPEAPEVAEGEPAPPPGPRVFEWSKEWPAFAGSEEVALRLNDRPHVVVFVGTSATQYAGHLDADLSPLLDGDLEVSVAAGLDVGDDATPAGCPPPPLLFIRFTVTLSAPLLDDDLRHKLNPMAVTVRSVQRLPGITLADGVDPSMRRFVEPTPYAVLESTCAPLCAVYRLFDGDGAPRVVRSQPQPQGPGVAFAHKSVFLVGTFSTGEIQEHLVTQPLEVEVHDRARVGWACQPAFPPEVAAEWDAMVGNPPPGDAADTAPLDVFGVDEVVLAALDAGLRAAGDDNPHGGAVVRLSQLLDRGNERLDLLKQSLAHKADVAASAVAAEESAASAAAAARRRRRAEALKNLGVAVVGEALPDGESGEDGGAQSSPPSPTAAAADGPPSDEAPFKPLWRPGHHDPISMSYGVDVAPRKRRVVPRDLSSEIDLTPEERLASQPGAYLLSGAHLKVVATLARPVHDVAPTEAAPPLPFTRAVFVMRYAEDAMLKAALSVIEEVNMVAAAAASSTRSYELTAEEAEAANAGTMDILTGFQVVDDRWRVLVLEGLVDGAMAKLTTAVARTFPNSLTVKYLANPEVQFTSRLYTPFNIAPKDIRLREPLTHLMKHPGLYDRSKVSQLCFDALFRLTETRRAARLAHLKALALFPTPDSLNELENKYGDTVTLRDIYGDKRSEGQAHAARLVGSPTASPSRLGTAASKVMQGALSGDKAGAGATAHRTSAHPPSRHAPMETTNEAYLEALARRGAEPVPDFLEANRQAVAGQGATMGRTASSVDMEGVELPGDGETAFVYSGQKLQYTELQKDLMRKRLAKDKRATYTYSSEYQSLTVSLVNEGEIHQQEAEAAKSKWTTKRGFVYPAPKDPAEFRRLPKGLSDAAKEDLKQPWNDPHDRPPEHLLHKDTRKPFDTVPVRDAVFGYVDAEGNDHTQAFFKSVHLSGDGVEAEELAAKKKAEEEWLSKVVVDNLQFRPHFAPKKITQMNKLEGILAGPPQSKPLRIVHNAKLPSGKKAGAPSAPPISALNAEPYTTPVDFTAGLKPNLPDALGRPGFTTTVSAAKFKPKTQTLRHTRPIPPLEPSECRGPAWGK